MKYPFSFSNAFRILLGLTGLAGIFLILWTGYLAWHGTAIYNNITAARSVAASGLNRAAAEGELSLLHDTAPHIRAIDEVVRPFLPLFDLLAHFPPFQAASQVRPALDLTSSLLDSALAAARGFEPLLTQVDTHPSSLLHTLRSAQPDFAAAQAALARAQIARAGLDPLVLPLPLRVRLIGPLSRFDDLLSQAQGGLALLQLAPSLAGLDRDRVYLLVAQNSDELRATGGFISALGPLRLRSGIIADFNLADSFSIDDYTKGYPSPPDPILRYMLAGYWVPRDANWSPHFPQSAADLSHLYNLSTGQSVEGVIAFDPAFITALIRVLGPLQVPGPPQPLTADTVVEWMRRAWSPEGGQGEDPQWWANRKNFTTLLGKTLTTAFFNAGFDTMLAASNAALRAAREGHLLVWIPDPDTQAALSLAHLDGSVSPGSADFLLLVDSNIGFNKTDAIIARRLAYTVDLTDLLHPRAMLHAGYANPATRGLPCVHEARYGIAYEDLIQRCYWDYWRVLAAPGSVLKSYGAAAIPPGPALLNPAGWPGTVQQSTGPAGTVEFAGLLLIPPQSTGGYTLTWDLPAAVLTHPPNGYRYTLRLAKQPGLLALPFSLDLLFPQGCSSVSPLHQDIHLTTPQTLTYDFACP